MKSREQLIFDAVLKNTWQEILKTQGFKKKGTNFYHYENGLGKLMNFQKGRYNSSDEISFTINAGIFLPEFWLVYYDFQKKGLVPDFPSEPECIIRKRVPQLKGLKQDQWYQITKNTDEKNLVAVVEKDVRDFVLPFFSEFKSKEKIIEYARKNKYLDVPLGKLIIFAEFGFREEAKNEIELLKKDANNFFRKTIDEYANRYQLN